MSIKVINDVFDNSEMRGNDRLVMLAIADNADDEKRQAWPSVTHLAHKTRIPIRTVWRCIKRCVASGELAIVRSGSKDGGSNLYQINVERSSRIGHRGAVKMTGVPPVAYPPMPPTGKPPMPPSGTLTVIEPSVQPGPPKKPGGVDRIILDKEYDRILEEMRAIKRTYADHQTWNTRDVDRWRELVARKQELKKQLGIKV